MAKKQKLTEEQRAELRRRSAEKRHTLLAALKSKNAVERAEMLAAVGGPLRTVDGHVLSEHNSLLIAMQAAAAGVSLSLVGGIRQWKTHGRMVRKGARGLCFWYPFGVGAAAAGAGDGDGDGEGDGEGDGDGAVGSGRPKFRAAYYWDISQTIEIGAAGAAAGGDGDGCDGCDGDGVEVAAAGDSVGENENEKEVEEMKKCNGEAAENLNLFNRDLFEHAADPASAPVVASAPAASAPAAAAPVEDAAAALLAAFARA